MTRSRPPGAVLKALIAAAEPFPDADPLLVVLARRLARDVDEAESVSQRVSAVRALLDVADRLSLVPLAPGRGSGSSAPAAGAEPAGPAGEGGDGDGDNPFGVPDLPPGVGDAA